MKEDLKVKQSIKDVRKNWLFKTPKPILSYLNKSDSSIIAWIIEKLDVLLGLMVLKQLNCIWVQSDVL